MPAHVVGRAAQARVQHIAARVLLTGGQLEAACYGHYYWFLQTTMQLMAVLHHL